MAAKIDLSQSYAFEAEQADFEFDDLYQAPIAVLADIGVSLANSFLPEDNEYETSDVLESFGADGAAEFYQQHRDGVELTSFVGGLFVPGTIAAKAIRYARTGKAGIFGKPLHKLDQKITNSKKAAQDAIKADKGHTEAYRQAISSTRLASLGEGVVEGIVYEAAILGLYNGHSYMEDYDASDVALGVALGGVLSPLNYLVRRRELILGVKETEMAINAQVLPTDPRAFIAAGDTPGQKLATYKNLLEVQEEALKIPGIVPATSNRIQENIVATKDLMLDSILKTSSKELKDTFELLSERTTTDLINSTRETFEANPLESVLQILKSDPNALNGYKKLDTFTEESSLIVSHVPKISKDNKELFSETGESLARELRTFYGSGKEAAEDLLDVTIEDGIASVILTSKNSLGKNSEELGALLKLIDKTEKPVQIKFADGTFWSPKFRRQLEGSEAVAEGFAQGSNARFRDRAVHPREFKELQGEHSLKAVITNIFGTPKIIDSMQAKVIQGVADTKDKWKPSRGYSTTGEVKYDPLNASIYNQEAEFLDSLLAFDKLKSLGKDLPTEYTIKAGDVPRLQAAISANRSLAEGITPVPIKLDGIVLKDAEATLAGLKIAEIQKQIKAGFSPEQAAKANNVPLETVSATIENGFKRVKDADYQVYTEAKAIDSYLKPTMIDIQGNSLTYARREEMAQTSLLDLDQLKDANRVMQEETMGAYATNHLKEFFDDTTLSGETAKLVATLPELTARHGAITKGTLVSSDQALRETGLAGQIVVSLSQKLNRLVSNRTAAVREQIKPVLKSIADNPIARTQFYQMRNALEAIPSEAASELALVRGLDGAVNIKTKDGFLTYPGTSDVIDLPREAVDFFDVWLGTDGRGGLQAEFLADLNTQRRLQGKDPIKGRGIWLPDQQTDNSLIAYVINTKNPADVKRIIGRDADHLAEEVASFTGRNQDAGIKVITNKDHLDQWNRVHGYAQTEQLSRANVSRAKSGSASTEIPADARGLDSIMEVLEQETWKNFRSTFKLTNSDLFDSLETAIGHERRFDSAGSKASASSSAASLAYKTLLNVSKLEEGTALAQLNNAYTIGLNNAISVTRKTFGLLNKAKESEQDFIATMARLEAEGIPVPFKDFSEYMIRKGKGIREQDAQNFVAKASAALVALNLRVFEISHAAVTMLSLPVIVGAELTSQTGLAFPLKHMMDGMKLATSKHPDDVALMARAKELGYTGRATAEVTELMESLHTTPGVLADLERKDNTSIASKTFKALVKPSDQAETMVREIAYATGYRMAKAKHPNDAEAVIESLANAFTLRTMGNYNARQRPAMFQGAMGATVGLYQTFMLTMAQNMARYVERGDKKALGLLLGGQASMFGIESLPGYDAMNEIIGEYVGDPNSHQDIRQTVYNAYGNDDDQSRSAAQFLLYGFPSTLFQTAIHTRGDLQLRSPITLQDDGFQFAPPIVNATKDAYDFTTQTVARTLGTLASGGNIKDGGRAVLEGLAAQSLWRPAARFAELGLGYSQDRTKAQVSSEAEVGGWAQLSRVMGARPLKEQSLRTLKFSGKYYDAIDNTNRRDAISNLRGLVRGKNKSAIGNEMQKYLDAGGTARGWNQALNTAYAGLDNTFAERLHTESTKQEGIADLIQTYN